MPFPQEIFRLMGAEEADPETLTLLKVQSKSDVADFILALYDQGKVYLTASPEDSKATLH